jgi:predicted ABC-type ATPase
MPARIFVLSGVNGAGKSSIGGAALLAKNSHYFNPNLIARKLVQHQIAHSLEDANAKAWQMGRSGLARAIEGSETFAFETTLGASTISNMLLAAARDGAQINVWYAGLSSPELHIRRVQARVAVGGHDIPEAKIRARFDTSRTNLIRLLPHVATLRVYDNSVDGDPKRGVATQPALVLHTQSGRIVSLAPSTPQWAKPIAAAALKLRR